MTEVSQIKNKPRSLEEKEIHFKLCYPQVTWYELLIIVNNGSKAYQKIISKFG